MKEFMRQIPDLFWFFAGFGVLFFLTFAGMALMVWAEH